MLVITVSDREQVQQTVFVADLASVQVTLRLDVFQSSNKLILASNLLTSRADSPKVGNEVLFMEHVRVCCTGSETGC